MSQNCYRSGGCGPYENRPCSECPASKPEYRLRYSAQPKPANTAEAKELAPVWYEFLCQFVVNVLGEEAVAAAVGAGEGVTVQDVSKKNPVMLLNATADAFVEAIQK